MPQLYARSRSKFALALAFAFFNVAGALAAPPTPHTVTFDSGTEGWSVSGRDNVGGVGNPGPALNVELIDVFGADIRNDLDYPNFRGDYTQLPAFRLSVDIKTDSITFFGAEVERDLVIEIRDTTTPSGDFPYTSVWARVGTLSAALPGWRTFSVDVLDPLATDLPAGWGGYGAEDEFGNPILPKDRTFASVLKQADEIHFTTFVPGFFYGFTNFVMQVDNIELEVIPAPGTAAASPIIMLALLRRRRYVS